MLYFDWKAAGGGDAYDAFGYLLNTDNGTSTIVLNQTGANAGATTPWATLNVTVPTSGNYKFVFVSGTWDASGGRVAGGSLYVDNFKVFSNSVTDAVAQSIAQHIAYQNTAEDAPVSRTLTLSVASVGGVSTAPTSLDITLVNDAPTFTAGATLAAVNEDTLNPAGATVSSLLESQFTDPDNVYTPTDTLAGIAIDGNTSPAEAGAWQYSTDNGVSWQAVGTVSTSSALLLSASSLVRFLPAANWNGTPDNLSVHAVDSSNVLPYTSGATRATFDTTTDGITSPVSSLAVTIGTSITPVPDAPNFTSSAPTISYTDTQYVDTFATKTGTLVAINVDAGAANLVYGITGGTDNHLNGTVSKSNAYGTLTVTTATGAYSFVPTSATIEPLGAAASDATLSVTVSNGGPIGSQIFTVAITQTGSTETIGNDTLAGTAGADNWAGLAGDDTYTVNNVGDVITEQANEGLDIVNSSITYTLGANVEQLVLTGTAATGGYGNAQDNRITGNSAANIIDGKVGADTMIGGDGNDSYGVDNVGDVVTETTTTGGWDTVWASINYAIAANSNIEGLWFNEGAGNLNGWGNAQTNYLKGNSGNNILDGQGGADTMLGGLGNDSYYVDNALDVVTENANEGTDTVNAGITYTLGVNVENLVLTGTTAINGYGNTADNSLTGNSAVNTLDGGVGADTMAGGAGGDLYYVDNIGDVITETASADWDSVYSTVNYTLSANVDALVLTGTATNATGNATYNYLVGNSANNVIDGKLGADRMVGGKGDDAYAADNTDDTVVEYAGEGWDTVWAGAHYTLSANVDGLWFYGTGNFNGYGNGDYNYMVGNSGANLLDGQGGNDNIFGGEGADILIGSIGQDRYDLTEITQVTDTIRVATGDAFATLTGFDYAVGFKLGTGTVNTSGVDKLDLVTTTIAADTAAVDGVNSGPILSHSITNGIISFDDLDSYAAPLTLSSDGYLPFVFEYLQNNITGNSTVAFVQNGNTFVFQDDGATDTIVELVGVTATSLNTTGLATNSVWIA